MKLVSAIVRPHKVEDIKDALQDIGVHGLTLSEVRGFGRQRGHTEVYRGAEYEIEFVPKSRLDVLAPADQVDEIIETLIKAARTGQVGDGKVFVTDLERIVRVRTGEENEDAL